MYCRPNESSFHGKGLHLHLCFDPIYGAMSTSAADDDYCLCHVPAGARSWWRPMCRC